MNKSCSNIYDYIIRREQGIRSGSHSRQLEIQENLIANNMSKLKSSKFKFSPSNENTKAFLIVMSIDMCYFAVSTSENCVGIYCSITGELIQKLYGSKCPIYTITWHPHLKNIIACSNLSGSVFVWDISLKNNSEECWFLHNWEWPPFSSITYSIDFHPFSSIMTIARDREIRFVNWGKGHHIAHWRFYSEFSWVPWVSWSFVGSSILVSIGNPQDNSFLHSIINSISQEKNSFSPFHTTCSHADNNDLCDRCDTCPKMSMLEAIPPPFNEYRVNAVDLIRYVLSRTEDWFVKNFICTDCRLRFKLWANSIQIHEKYNLDSNLNDTDGQLPYDVESIYVTVIESPAAPEIIWDTLQAMDDTCISDSRLSKFLIPKSDTDLQSECRTLLRCVAMFERECLRQSICWCCIQQIHNWILQLNDFPKFLYESMLNVRSIVIDRIKHFDMNIFQDELQQSQFFQKMMNATGKKMFTEIIPEKYESTSKVISDEVNTCSHKLHNDTNGLTNRSDSMFGGELRQNVDKNLNFNDQPRCKRSSIYKIDCGSTFIENKEENNAESDRLKYLRLTLKLLQVYVAEPSRLGDLINILLTNNLNRMGMLFRPSLYGSKIESYSIRRWHIQPLGQTRQKIYPRNDCTESNIIVPYLVFSSTGLTASSIKMSKCGRTIAVFVPQNSFRRLHSIDQGHNDTYSRKRRHSFAFNGDSVAIDEANIFPRETGNVIAVYSSEPESICGQLLYYFEMPFDPISLDFSPLGDLLLIGLSGSKHQSLWSWPSTDGSVHSCSFVDLGLTLNTHCNIGAILKINNVKNDENSKVGNLNAQKMQLRQILQQDKNTIYHDCSDHLTWNGPINCAIWNTAGGLLYSKEPGTLFTINFVGGTN